ncbi:Cyclopropane-fatty-acyl-phospholipid synthase OS=Tsukamurella paurometabola (strain ATCC 8368 / DSM / CCUG 35730 / CIP 100753 / JCM 10117 / KCTC 9821 /NBRC 16120 / NCIMB 702349 / NCTC 13040) OX=521096 GN=Tpau_0036 PE=3 SV=1 [Tsukamurella paurometabola]|uniref:Cyclopropane-fatty-acyl-phospholipid synthase n=1 Tax=Tsukamurella paurometabola (strain ATCC 8368 / DSM 20162 / CCUG 35730 / CIP 100753 / JCM 10117 / KCTC 9821 / NBRC 16120 / NCIMB 702349 / NCTC 13040) TaxID=521096 RepID=D5UPS2_TSUPD|nr:cyclopropane mycolic acid synthase family methyltransferase [Tsukamurella paurometabola]ADG76690.1 Cyclopropane-fatty-acyl-phospholipid synthase [Tsukamurella paurometabola DSM 20162]SUP41234.1 Cyclopropane mycolic acid synthase 1 [Tsukamurella paurometabola]
MPNLDPHFDDVQAHYDLSDDFFRLFLDPTQTYSCAYFERDDMTLEEAQLAKVDLSLGKLDLKPGMTLLDVGCGWGTTLIRALEKYDVNVIGLTLSKNQYEAVSRRLGEVQSERSAEVRLQGWEEFDGAVDAIVSIGAFEHFTHERHLAFFDRAFDILPAGGRAMIHTIMTFGMDTFRGESRVTRADFDFFRFIRTEIFPGGELPITKYFPLLAEMGGFDVTRIQSLQPHYAKTLDIWAANLEAAREQALHIHPQSVYDTYIKYLTGCADAFRRGLIDVRQHTLVKPEHDARHRTLDEVLAMHPEVDAAAGTTAARFIPSR